MCTKYLTASRISESNWAAVKCSVSAAELSWSSLSSRIIRELAVTSYSVMISASRALRSLRLRPTLNSPHSHNTGPHNNTYSSSPMVESPSGSAISPVKQQVMRAMVHDNDACYSKLEVLVVLAACYSPGWGRRTGAGRGCLQSSSPALNSPVSDSRSRMCKAGAGWRAASPGPACLSPPPSLPQALCSLQGP